MDDLEPDKAPRLTGIPSKESAADSSVEAVNPRVKLAVQFFIVPIAIVVLCVGLIFVFRWLTWENRDVSSYLNALSSATRPASSKEQDALKLLNYIQESNRWQSIYDVTEQLRINRKDFLAKNPEFAAKVSRIFQQSTGADHRVRQYLAQVLGLVGDREVVPVLIAALEDSDTETAIHSMVALGRIGDSSAISALLAASRGEDRGLRQTAIFALGNFNDSKAGARCVEALNDPDVLVGWNAAFALGRKNDARSLPVLERFLDAGYVERVAHGYSPTPSVSKNGMGSAPTFRPEQLEQYRMTAVRLLGQLALNDRTNSAARVVREKLRKVADQDKQLKVRQAAIEALKKGDEGRGGADKGG